MPLNKTDRIGSSVRRLGKSLLVRNTASMVAGSGVRLLIQGVYFVLIARALGADQYGGFIGVVALVAILAPFAPFGTGQILIRNVARDRKTFRYSWGNALWMTGVSGSVLLVAVMLLARLVLAQKIPLTLVFLVGLSDLLIAASVGIAAQAFQAFEQLHRTAQLYVILTSARAASALALFLLVSHPTALSWGYFYCLSSLVGGVYAVALVCSKLGTPILFLRRLRADLLEGFYFSIGLSSSSIYNNIDKTMLVRLATFGAAGIYAAAYKLLDLSFQPVGALMAATYPRFFRYGEDGLRGTRRLVKQLLPFAAIYAVLAGAILFLVAPLLPLVLGHDFREAEEALRWLSPIVLFRAVNYIFSNCLTGADFQGLRSGIQVMVAGLNVLLNLWLIPAYSWRGAAWASLASDGALAACMFLAVAVLGRRYPASTAEYGVETKVIT